MLGKKLAAGGFGTVYRADLIKEDKEVQPVIVKKVSHSTAACRAGKVSAPFCIIAQLHGAAHQAMCWQSMDKPCPNAGAVARTL